MPCAWLGIVCLSECHMLPATPLCSLCCSPSSPAEAESNSYTTIFYLKNLQPIIHNFVARIHKWTYWAESAPSAAKVVSARSPEMLCAQDCAQDFAQVNYAYLSAKWWIHNHWHRGVEFSPAQHAASRMQVQLETNISSQSQQKHESPSRDQQSSFARLLESRQWWQKATI